MVQDGTAMTTDPEVYNSSAQDLARLFKPDCGQERLWKPEELAAIFRHQMSATVQFDLAGVEPGLAAKLSALASAEGLLVRSFADLFAHPNPPVELLRMTKEFAKAAIEHPDSPLPPEMARLRCGQSISELDDPAIARGLDWVLAQTWVDDATKSVLREGRALLTTGREQRE
jgi:hypothetical protein